MIMVLGEITSAGHIDYQKVIRDTIKRIGYDDSSKGSFLVSMLDGTRTRSPTQFKVFSTFRASNLIECVHGMSF